ncbi:MAG: glycosyltransferase, partial [Dehalococcoidia bacterium]
MRRELQRRDGEPMRAAARDRTIKVTLIGSLPPHRGISRYVQGLATALAGRDDVSLEVLSFASLYPGWLYPGGDPKATGAATSDVPGGRVRRSLRWWNPAGWLLDALTMRGAVVHAQWWSFPLAPVFLVLLAGARMRRRSVVITVHNVEPHEGGRLRRLANRAVLPLAHHIVVHTEANRAALVARGIGGDRVSVLPMGIAPPTARMDAAAARSAIGLPAGAPVVLFAGNIRAYKGLDDLIQAFPLVLGRVPGARLVIAGQPWGDPSTIERSLRNAEISDAVTARLEYLSETEMSLLLDAADVVVYPYTHFDAQSAAAAEALRHGRAIVVTDVGGLPELVDDGAAIAPPRDHARLA